MGRQTRNLEIVVWAVVPGGQPVAGFQVPVCRVGVGDAAISGENVFRLAANPV
jgi:hypothetical protein